jgi:arylsulfatase A-like enzyme
LPQYLARHGYHSYTAGKIYHGSYGRGPGDEEFQVIGPAASVGARPTQKLVDTPAPHPLGDWGTFAHRDQDKGDWRVAGWAVEQLRSGPPEPFFLSVGFFLPHVPCYATQEWFDLYPAQSLILPKVLPDDRADTPRFSWYLHWKLPEPRYKFLQQSDQHANLVRSYLACVSFVDSQVGRVISALEESGLAQNTIIVLWSDHGWHLGEKLITGKNTLWERSTRVPLIFAGPSISAGATCSQPVELLDIYPTLIDLCGLPARSDLEGHSLRAQLEDPLAERPWPAITTHNHDNHAVRTQRWRFIQYADGTRELYDMQDDPQEWHNLASDPRYAATMAELVRWLPPVSAKPAPGSASRILIYENGRANWEGQDIESDAPIPEL